MEKLDLKRKYDEQNTTHQNGAFKETEIPMHVFPVGEDTFIKVDLYKENVFIHIRRYNKFADKFYPTKEVVVLYPEQFLIITTVPIYEFVNINEKLKHQHPNDERKVQLVENAYGKYTIVKSFPSRSGEAYNQQVSINLSQWRKSVDTRDKVIGSVLHLKFGTDNFKQVFKLFSKCVVNEEIPEVKNYFHVECSLDGVFKEVLFEHIGRKKGIKPVVNLEKINEKGVACSVPDFIESCLSLNMKNFVNDFEKSLKEKKLSPEGEVPLINFLNASFLESINFKNVLLTVKRKFCSDIDIVDFYYVDDSD